MITSRKKATFPSGKNGQGAVCLRHVVASPLHDPTYPNIFVKSDI
jgi:hypothetical protein